MESMYFFFTVFGMALLVFIYGLYHPWGLVQNTPISDPLSTANPTLNQIRKAISDDIKKHNKTHAALI